MAYIDMELVKGPELRSIIEALNGSGLLAEPIDLKKGRRVANLASDFVKAIEACNAGGQLDNVPEAVFNYYVHVVKEGEPPVEQTKAPEDEEAKAAAKAAAVAEKKAKAEADKAAKAATAAAEAEAKAAADADAKAAAAAEKKAKAEAKAAAAAEKKAAAAEKKAPAKAKAPAKKAPAKAKAPAKKPAKAKAPILVKASIFGKLLLSKKTKKWDVTELVNELAEKTKSPYVDTRRKCNTYIALLRTMGVLEDAGEALVLSEWYRKALADK